MRGPQGRGARSGVRGLCGRTDVGRVEVARRAKGLGQGEPFGC